MRNPFDVPLCLITATILLKQLSTSDGRITRAVLDIRSSSRMLWTAARVNLGSIPLGSTKF
jgi:hypothetical protein